MKTHKDIAIQLSHDILLNMNQENNASALDNSRNKNVNNLHYHDSTRERLDQQVSVQSVSQFTFSNNINSLNPDGIRKISKPNVSLFADYRQNPIDEEEKDPSPLISSPTRVRKLHINSSDEEEEKKSNMSNSF